jgi:hypothetical protein
LAADQQPLQFPRTPSLGRDYLLARCEGYRVDADGRRVGTVADVLFRARHDRPDALVVRTGLLRMRFVVLSVDDVVEIVPREQRLQVSRSPALPEPGLLADLWSRLRR